MRKNKNEIEIVNLPRDLNLEQLFKDRLFKEFGKCPFCGCDKKRYTDPDIIFKNRGIAEYLRTSIGFFSNKCYVNYNCNECGAEWNSPKYPAKYLSLKYYKNKGVFN